MWFCVLVSMCVVMIWFVIVMWVCFSCWYSIFLMLWFFGIGSMYEFMW